ncbi:MAG: hypothetical protein Greene041662_50 [Candidatus Peregrinibacteria bacterium Greene0416_62]|nr:MAG: hypothetical protein Greene041662_50 [Candidatus Peregrinibacteria bacterium Greene0416_62]TSC98376.1 MAG: hypothetical protein Greene101449_942 [Candidatus Peregrinibacteria bacterium Greene1014_49]
MNSLQQAIGEQTITVFGSEGNWGNRIVNTLRPHAKRVLCCDPKLKQASADPRDATAEADVIVYAVFPDQMNHIVDETQHLIMGQSILEITSVKQPIIPTLQKLDEMGASVVATHPLVLPTMSSVRGQRLLLMRVGTNSAVAETLAREVFGTGMEMIIHDEIPLDRHDAVMVPQQGVLHATNIAQLIMLAEMVEHGNVDLQLLLRNSTANFDLNALGQWRTARSGANISSALIEGALQTDLGLEMLERLKRTLDRVIGAVKAGALSDLLDPALQTLDPHGEIRKEMSRKGDIVLTRFGNLRRLSFQLLAKESGAGVLHQITEILLKHGISMNAIDSNVLQKGDNKEVTFDIGIEESEIDWLALEAELSEAGFVLTR